MPWPIGADYQDAIQSPGASLADPATRSCVPALDSLGLPRASTGNFAIVFQLREPAGRKWAFRCFLRELPDYEKRYAEVSRHLRASSLRCSVGFEFLSRGILIDGRWYPALKMEWVDGALLHTYVESILGDHQALQRLAADWLALIRDLRRAGVAHGDLQHRNVIVAGGELRLIDYDAMFVPTLQGLASHEVGNPCYQHPRRGSPDYGPDLDRFAALVIYTALWALDEQPDLWRQFHNGDNLLFRREDFVDPSASRLFAALATLRDPRAASCVAALRTACLGGLHQVPELEALLGTGVVPGTPPSPPRLPEWIADWVPRPALPAASFVFAFDPVWTRPTHETRKVVRQEPVFRKCTRQVRQGQITARGWAALVAYLALTAAALLAVPTVWVGLPCLALGLLAFWLAERWQGKRVVVVRQTTREQVGVREVEEVVKVRLAGHSGPVLAVAFSRDGGSLCSGGADGCACCWSRETGEPLQVILAHAREVTSVAPASAGRIVTGSRDHTIKVWRSDGSLERTLEAPSGSQVNCVAASPDGRLVAVAIGQKRVLVWSVATGKLRATFQGHTRKVLAVAFFQDGRRLVSASADMSLRLWDVPGQRCDAVLQGHNEQVISVAISPDDNWIASGGSDGTIILWDAKAGAEVLRVSGGASAVTALAFSPDGASLVYGGPDGQIRCLGIASGQETACLAAHPTRDAASRGVAIRGLALSPDGEFLASCGDDGAVRAWRHR